MCTDRKAGKVGAYVKNLPGRDGPQIFFCEGYFNYDGYPSLQTRKNALDKEPENQKDIKSYTAVARLFIHEMVSMHI